MNKNQKLFFLILMSLMMVVLNADSEVMTPTLGIIEREFGITDADIGVMMGLFTVIGAMVSLLWGYFADKASRKALLIAAVVIGELPCFLTAFAHTYTVFFILRILTGIGMGAAFPLVFSMVGDIYDEKERPVASAILTTAFGLGNIVGAVIGGYIGASGNWRLPFIVAAAPNLPLILLFAFFLPEPQKAASEEATRDLVAQGVLYPKVIRLSDYVNLARVKTNIYLFIQGIAGTIPWGSFFFLTKFLIENKSLSIANATTVFLIFGIGMVIGTLIGGKWGEVVFRKNPKQLPIFCAVTTFIGMGLTIIVILFAPPQLILLSVLGFMAAGFAAMTGPNMRTMLLDTNTPENRGPIFSIFNLTDSLGTGLGRYVAGQLSVLFGLAASLSISAGFWTICGITLLLSASVFPADIERLHISLKKIAEDMKATARA